ncbi:unnamed protein product [Cyprideis torosa]|uniref:Uncharacterized protein n=1 Tax=Cyprideis torosa TaxID=163714 RepID=A0A7R8WGL3_9CRUS|nr:unnamed protein product [Cyprideis torosa]CAG0898327.1 unnamed protein product [Cyprideis torosa]
MKDKGTPEDREAVGLSTTRNAAPISSGVPPEGRNMESVNDHTAWTSSLGIQMSQKQIAVLVLLLVVFVGSGIGYTGNGEEVGARPGWFLKMITAIRTAMESTIPDKTLFQKFLSALASEGYDEVKQRLPMRPQSYRKLARTLDPSEGEDEEHTEDDEEQLETLQDEDAIFQELLAAAESYFLNETLLEEGSTQDEFDEEGSTDEKSEKKGSTDDESEEKSSMDDESEENGSSDQKSEEKGSTGEKSKEKGSTGNESEEYDLSDQKSEEKGSTDERFDEKGSMDDESVENGSSDQATEENGSTDEKSEEKGSTDEKSEEKGSTDEKSEEKGSTDEKSEEKESTNDESEKNGSSDQIPEAKGLTDDESEKKGSGDGDAKKRKKQKGPSKPAVMLNEQPSLPDELNPSIPERRDAKSCQSAKPSVTALDKPQSDFDDDSNSTETINDIQHQLLFKVSSSDVSAQRSRTSCSTTSATPLMKSRRKRSSDSSSDSGDMSQNFGWTDPIVTLPRTLNPKDGKILSAVPTEKPDVKVGLNENLPDPTGSFEAAAPVEVSKEGRFASGGSKCQQQLWPTAGIRPPPGHNGLAPKAQAPDNSRRIKKLQLSQKSWERLMVYYQQMKDVEAQKIKAVSATDFQNERRTKKKDGQNVSPQDGSNSRLLSKRRPAMQQHQNYARTQRSSESTETGSSYDSSSTSGSTHTPLAEDYQKRKSSCLAKPCENSPSSRNPLGNPSGSRNSLAKSSNCGHPPQNSSGSQHVPAVESTFDAKSSSTVNSKKSKFISGLFKAKPFHKFFRKSKKAALRVRSGQDRPSDAMVKKQSQRKTAVLRPAPSPAPSSADSKAKRAARAGKKLISANTLKKSGKVVGPTSGVPQNKRSKSGKRALYMKVYIDDADEDDTQKATIVPPRSGVEKNFEGKVFPNLPAPNVSKNVAKDLPSSKETLVQNLTPDALKPVSKDAADRSGQNAPKIPETKKGSVSLDKKKKINKEAAGPTKNNKEGVMSKEGSSTSGSGNISEESNSKGAMAKGSKEIKDEGPGEKQVGKEKKNTSNEKGADLFPAAAKEPPLRGMPTDHAKQTPSPKTQAGTTIGLKTLAKPSDINTLKVLDEGQMGSEGSGEEALKSDTSGKQDEGDAVESSKLGSDSPPSLKIPDPSSTVEPEAKPSTWGTNKSKNTQPTTSNFNEPQRAPSATAVQRKSPGTKAMEPKDNKTHSSASPPRTSASKASGTKATGKKTMTASKPGMASKNLPKAEESMGETKPKAYRESQYRISRQGLSVKSELREICEEFMRAEEGTEVTDASRRGRRRDRNHRSRRTPQIKSRKPRENEREESDENCEIERMIAALCACQKTWQSRKDGKKTPGKDKQEVESGKVCAEGGKKKEDSKTTADEPPDCPQDDPEFILANRWKCEAAPSIRNSFRRFIRAWMDKISPSNSATSSCCDMPLTCPPDISQVVTPGTDEVPVVCSQQGVSTDTPSTINFQTPLDPCAAELEHQPQNQPYQEFQSSQCGAWGPQYPRAIPALCTPHPPLLTHQQLLPCKDMALTTMMKSTSSPTMGTMSIADTQKTNLFQFASPRTSTSCRLHLPQTLASSSGPFGPCLRTPSQVQPVPQQPPQPVPCIPGQQSLQRALPVIKGSNSTSLSTRTQSDPTRAEVQQQQRQQRGTECPSTGGTTPMIIINIGKQGSNKAKPKVEENSRNTNTEERSDAGTDPNMRQDAANTLSYDDSQDHLVEGEQAEGGGECAYRYIGERKLGMAKTTSKCVKKPPTECSPEEQQYKFIDEGSIAPFAIDTAASHNEVQAIPSTQGRTATATEAGRPPAVPSTAVEVKCPRDQFTQCALTACCCLRYSTPTTPRRYQRPLTKAFCCQHPKGVCSFRLIPSSATDTRIKTNASVPPRPSTAQANPSHKPLTYSATSQPQTPRGTIPSGQSWRNNPLPAQAGHSKMQINPDFQSLPGYLNTQTMPTITANPSLVQPMVINPPMSYSSLQPFGLHSYAAEVAHGRLPVMVMRKPRKASSRRPKSSKKSRSKKRRPNILTIPSPRHRRRKRQSTSKESSVSRPSSMPMATNTRSPPARHLDSPRSYASEYQTAGSPGIYCNYEDPDRRSSPVSNDTPFQASIRICNYSDASQGINQCQGGPNTPDTRSSKSSVCPPRCGPCFQPAPPQRTSIMTIPQCPPPPNCNSQSALQMQPCRQYVQRDPNQQPYLNDQRVPRMPTYPQPMQEDCVRLRQPPPSLEQPGILPMSPRNTREQYCGPGREIALESRRSMSPQRSSATELHLRGMTASYRTPAIASLKIQPPPSMLSYQNSSNQLTSTPQKPRPEMFQSVSDAQAMSGYLPFAFPLMVPTENCSRELATPGENLRQGQPKSGVFTNLRSSTPINYTNQGDSLKCDSGYIKQALQKSSKKFDAKYKQLKENLAIETRERINAPWSDFCRTVRNVIEDKPRTQCDQLLQEEYEGLRGIIYEYHYNAALRDLTSAPGLFASSSGERDQLHPDQRQQTRCNRIQEKSPSASALLLRYLQTTSVPSEHHSTHMELAHYDDPRTFSAGLAILSSSSGGDAKTRNSQPLESTNNASSKALAYRKTSQLQQPMAEPKTKKKRK